MKNSRTMLLSEGSTQLEQNLPVRVSKLNNNIEDDSEKRLLPFAKSNQFIKQPERMQVLYENQKRGISLVFIFIIFIRFALECIKRKRLKPRSDRKVLTYSSKSQQDPARLSRKVILFNICKLLLPPLQLLLLLTVLFTRIPRASALLIEDESVDPQPLIYLPAREIGSGTGPSSSVGGAWPAGQSVSSSSPALITAKCWNNYQTDEDCRHIQVITADQGADVTPDSSSSSLSTPRGSVQQSDDDSLISPVLLFESSSTLEPSNSILNVASDNSQSSSAFLVPPYFSGPTNRKPQQYHHPHPNDNNQNINIGQIDEQRATSYNTHRHHHPLRPSTPPTANDLFAAPPAGATLLPPINYIGGGYTTPAGVRHHSSDSGFVGTPRPRKPPKSTTAGRKCRDENDADCDEPDDENADGDEDDVEAGAGRADNNNNNIVVPNQNSYSDQRPASSSVSDEFGSGGGPDDDSEGDDDDSELESSGADDQSTITNNHDEQSTEKNRSGASFDNGQFVQITSVAAPDTPTPSDSAPGMSVSPASAEIEVVVHPTLPPTFPSSSTFPPSLTWPVANGDKDEETQLSSSYRPTSNFQTSSTTTTTTTTTIMPDDTFKSKPVFPPSSPATGIDGNEGIAAQSNRDENSADTNNVKQLGEGGYLENAQTTENIDLATFKPVPMPAVNPELQQPRRLPSDSYLNTFRSSAGGDSTSPQLSGTHKLQSNADVPNTDTDTGGQNRLADRHRLDFNTPLSEPSQAGTPFPQPVSPQIRPFESPWREKSWRSQSNAGNSPLGDHLSGGRSGNQEETDRRLLLSPQVSQAQQQQQSEMLPTLLLYASIIILVVTASIFVIMAFTFWRRNSVRQQALLSSKSALLNGNGPMGGFNMGNANYMANPHHLIGTQGQINQQPGLLTTYAPGKGLSSKLTSSLVKEEQEIAAEDEEDQVEEEEEEEEEEEDDGEEENDEEDSFRDSSKQRRELASDYGRNQQSQEQQRSAAQQSWSTEDNPTTSSAGSSQRTSESQQAIAGNHQTQRLRKRQQQHYPNSLSDGRQNSSSISDSQSSPVDTIQGPQQQQQQPINMLNTQQNQFTPTRAPHYPTNQNGAILSNHQYPAVFSQQPQPILYPNQYYRQHPVPSPHHQLHNGYHASPIPPVIKNGSTSIAFNSSRSMENLNNPPVNLLGPTYNSQLPIQALTNQQQRFTAPFTHPTIHNPMQPLRNTIYLPPETTQPAFMSPDHNHYQTRVTVNPLATMSRRQSNFINQPPASLNRQIYSEDSSSFISASPSLARTSSSSSFAFNVNQQLVRNGLFEQTDHPTTYQQRMARLV